MYRVKNVPEYDGMEYSMQNDKVPELKAQCRLKTPSIIYS